MDIANSSSRHNSVKAHALLRLSVARASDLARLATCRADDDGTDNTALAERCRAQVRLREEWRASYFGFPSAVPPVDLPGDDGDPTSSRRGGPRLPRRAAKAQSTELATDVEASVVLVRQLLQSAKSLKILYASALLKEEPNNRSPTAPRTNPSGGDDYRDQALATEAQTAWALVERTILVPLGALKHRLDPPDGQSSFAATAATPATALQPTRRPNAVAPLAAVAARPLAVRPHAAPGALVALGAETVRQRLQFSLLDRARARAAVVGAGTVLQRSLRRWCIKRRAAETSKRRWRAAAVVARWWRDIWPTRNARRARGEVAAAAVQKWCRRHWRAAVARRRRVSLATQQWLAGRVEERDSKGAARDAGAAALETAARAAGLRRLRALQAAWRGAAARRRVVARAAALRGRCTRPAASSAAASTAAAAPSAATLAATVAAAGAGRVGAAHGAPASVRGWAERRARQQRAWRVGSALVAARCGRDAAVAAAPVAAAELEAHVARALFAWAAEMRKVRVGAQRRGTCVRGGGWVSE